jgi:signal transduction histidine kinase
VLGPVDQHYPFPPVLRVACFGLVEGGGDYLGRIVAGRRALSDMRAMLGVLRPDDPPASRQQTADLAPQPGVDQLSALIARVRVTGLAVDLDIEGSPFPLGAAAGLSVYRIVQEALTNTIRHAEATRARVTIGYAAPRVEVEVADDGTAAADRPFAADWPQGHGIGGMRERAALHDGTVSAGPAAGGGWLVTASLHTGAAAA